MAELVMSTEQFEQYMSARQQQTFTWKEHMLPKISDVVWNSLKAVQETQEPTRNCFEVYGFDIVLDEDLRPWVIEINLSPACAERTTWLSKMLEDSALDMLGHVEQRILLMNPHDWQDKLQEKRDRAFLTY